MQSGGKGLAAEVSGVGGPAMYADKLQVGDIFSKALSAGDLKDKKKHVYY